jgi:hypothetical protein
MFFVQFFLVLDPDVWEMIYHMEKVTFWTNLEEK